MPDVPCSDLLGFVVGDDTVDVDALTADCEALRNLRLLILQKATQFTASATTLKKIKGTEYSLADFKEWSDWWLKYIDRTCGSIEDDDNPSVFSARTNNHNTAFPPTGSTTW